MKTLILTFALLFLVVPAFAQVNCAQMGARTSCDGPRGQSFDQLQLNRNQGVITDSQGRMEPYTILPAHPQPSRPLNDVLPTLPTLERPQVPASPYSSFETPSAPVFLYGTGEASGGGQ